MIDDTPVGALEEALDEARAGKKPVPDFLRLLVASDLAVPSGGEVKPDGEGFQPLLFNVKGGQMVACFTRRERIGVFAETAPYALMLNGGEFLRRVPKGYGLVINPGQRLGFEVSPQGLPKIVADFT